MTQQTTSIPRLAIVTATLDVGRALECISSWQTPDHTVDLIVVDQGQVGVPEYPGPVHQILTHKIKGVVPAFAEGVQAALETDAEIIACLHDDLLIEDPEWAQKVLEWFDASPHCGLLGFGGGTGLAAGDIYQTPYNPMQLARQDFVSNMRDAESHGRRARSGGGHRWPYLPERVACLDGFSQIGRREYWEGQERGRTWTGEQGRPENLFETMQHWGLIHHAYDAALGAFAARLGWEVWMLPIACHHYGGRTAVADTRYHEWANRYAASTERGGVIEGTGDQVFWERSHRIVYEQFRDVLPIRTR